MGYGSQMSEGMPSNIPDFIHPRSLHIAISAIDSLLSTNRLTQRSKAVGILLNGLSQAVERENPDILVVVGDREESIATAIVGNYMLKIVTK